MGTSKRCSFITIDRFSQPKPNQTLSRKLWILQRSSTEHDEQKGLIYEMEGASTIPRDLVGGNESILSTADIQNMSGGDWWQLVIGRRWEDDVMECINDLGKQENRYCLGNNQTREAGAHSCLTAKERNLGKT
uniref:Uncharacterized protein n=1 Tax=Micrurus corallinus TaxID=54390 RepID=A0A2D4G5P0_MICCO